MITNLTAVYKKVTEGYIGYVEEFPDAIQMFKGKLAVKLSCSLIFDWYHG